MSVDLESVKKRMAFLTDEELRRALGPDTESYEPEALDVARAELSRRQDAAAALIAVQHGSNLPPALFERPPPRYRPAPVLTGALVSLVLVQLLCCLSALAGYAVLRERIEQQHRYGALFDLANQAVVLGTRGRFAMFVVAVIVFCAWVHRMYRNLPALGSTSTAFTAATAVRQFFLPIGNLVLGYRVMRHLWIESQPEPAVLPDGRVLRRSAGPVGWWWGLFLGSNFITYGLESAEGSTLEGWLQQSFNASVWLGLVVVAGVAFLGVVRGVVRRQHDQWDELQRRKPVAPPTDRLR